MNSTRLAATTLFLLLSAPAAGHAQETAAALVGEGGQVFVANCTRCHNARAGSERTDAQWVPIVLHMRARANLTRHQARAVLAFLQATNRDSGAASVASESPLIGATPDARGPVVMRAEVSGLQSTGWLRLILHRAASGPALPDR